MKLEELQAEMEVDSKIDPNALDMASLEIPKIHAKWYRYFMDELRTMKLLDTEYKVLLKERTMYYLGTADDDKYKEEPLNTKVIKVDLPLHLESDTHLSKNRLRFEMQKAKVDMIEQFIKQLNNRSFQINNAIKWREFQAGK